MSECDAILDGRLFVGTYKAARDEQLLDRLGVTHIVACGFDTGHFDASGRYRYLCLDLPDIPTANLLRYLPRATSIIESALDDKDGNAVKKGVVLVHCVHGQSRSCAVCVAYLMKKRHGKAISDANERVIENSGIELLHECYDFVQNARPCMAINPGFVRQLEMFRRMRCGIDRACQKDSRPPATNAYAAFRSHRAGTEFMESGSISKWFPLQTATDFDELIASQSYRCKKCRVQLFCNPNIISVWSGKDQAALPASDYWKDSKGGRDYDQSKGKGNQCEKLTDLSSGVLCIEPIDWMQRQMVTNPESKLLEKCGKLSCPSCGCKLGNWDWNHSNSYVSIFITPARVEC